MLIAYCLASLILACAVCMVARRRHVWLPQVTYAAAVVGCLITASKISPIVPGVNVSVAIGLYSMTFLLTDFLGEVHTKREALRAVYMGIIAELLVLASITMALWIEPASFWTHQQAFEDVFRIAPRIMLASILAFVAAQLMDVTIFDWLKLKSGTRHLALRNNASTFVGQTIDSVIFYTIGFYGVVPDLMALIVATCVVKYIIALADTPFIYIARYWALRSAAAEDPAVLLTKAPEPGSRHNG